MVPLDDEILVKDKTGKFKILRGGKFYDLEENAPAKPTISGSSSQVDEILKQIRFKIDESLKPRLADVIEAYLKDVRDKFETKNILVREKKNGGMEFLPDEADIVISLIDKVGNKKEKEKKSVPQIPEKEVKQKEEPRGEKKDIDIGEDEREIALNKNKISQFAPPRNIQNLDEKVEEIIRESGVKIPESEEKKLRDILLTHLKDIRDDYELEDTLKNVFGTTSLKKEDIKKIIETARKKGRNQGEDLRRKKLEEIKEALEAERRRRENAFLDDQNKLSEKLKSRWQEITKRKETSSISLPEERLPRPEKTTPEILSLVEFANFLDSGKNNQREEFKNKEETVEEPVTPLSPRIETPKELMTTKAPASGKDVVEKVSASKADLPAVAPPLSLIETEKKEDKPKPLQVFKPVNIPLRRPPPVFRKDQPRLDDIKYIPRIVGPIDELRDMNLVNFRRLGETPEEVVEKIKEKLNILEHDSVIKRLAGIKAWQESEVVKIYLEISRDCLSKGASADQIIALRESSGKPTISLPEYKAILELNKFLRY